MREFKIYTIDLSLKQSVMALLSGRGITKDPTPSTLNFLLKKSCFHAEFYFLPTPYYVLYFLQKRISLRNCSAIVILVNMIMSRPM